MGGPWRLIGATIAVALLGAGVWLLRDATMSTHEPVSPDSRLSVAVDAELRRSEGGQTLLEMVTGKVLMCRLEVRDSDPVGGVEPVRGTPGRFRFVLQPTLDRTDRIQFRGCLEDWNLDHILVDVVDMHDVVDTHDVADG